LRESAAHRAGRSYTGPVETLHRLALAFLTAGIFILCDGISARWGKQGGIALLAILCVLASLGFVLFGVLNRSETLSTSSALVNPTIAIGTILVGVLLFQDPIGPRQLVGFLLAVGAVGLLSS
jgi:drug/metabolite transporter (DMT)-like permease